MTDEEELLARIAAWLSEQPSLAGRRDILNTRDAELLAGLILKATRPVAKDAGRGRVEGDEEGPCTSVDSPEANPVLRIFSGLAQAWQLSEPEQLSLLGLGTSQELESLCGMPHHRLPAPVVERVIILLDIFQAINTLLPQPARADQWIRAPNRAPLFGGRSALNLMRESLDGLRQVRRYLQAQVWSG